MISAYLNQTVTHKVRTGVNKFNEPTFAPNASIACRFEYRRKMVRNRESEQLMSEAILYTATKIKAGDVIIYDGIDWIVLTVTDKPDLSGRVLFYEVNL